MSAQIAAQLLAQARADDQTHAQRPAALLESHWAEDAHQIRFLEWVAEAAPQLPALAGFTHVPNGGKRPKKVGRNGQIIAPEALKLRLMGARAGYPDLLLDVAVKDFHGLRIELKKHGGELRSEQRAWLIHLRKYGYYADVAHGWREARQLTLEYLAGQWSGYRWLPRHKDRVFSLPPLPLDARSTRAR